MLVDNIIAFFKSTGFMVSVIVILFGLLLYSIITGIITSVAKDKKRASEARAFQTQYTNPPQV
jgi:hypothetical protein